MTTATPQNSISPTSEAGTSRLSSWWGTVAFEWTKLVSVRSTWWILASALACTLAGSWLLGASALASGRNGFDTAMPAPAIVVQTMLIVEMALVLLGTFAITSEYSTGSIMTTLQSVPRRFRVLAGKTVVLLIIGIVAGAALILVGTPVAAGAAAEFGRFESPDLARAMIGTGVGLALLSIFVLGLGAALRSAAFTIITALALLHVVPNILPLFGVEAISDLAQYLPNQAIAVLAVETTQPYEWPVALAVLVGWAGAGLLFGYAMLRSRDA
ncbi:hypothetical protein [Brevibacterium sp.]|uniref:hypothetical protein n=1 Tax=Brevibacterium sp. TaxID=1701 RepID=UPI002810F776|nr:hypothetical protein [Brevibacterium sp.]